MQVVLLAGGRSTVCTVLTRGWFSGVPLPPTDAGTLAPLMGVIVAVLTANAVAVLAGTEGVYESELEHEARVNYLPQVGPLWLALACARVGGGREGFMSIVCCRQSFEGGCNGRLSDWQRAACGTAPPRRVRQAAAGARLAVPLHGSPPAQNST